jgi:hypothetical protein
MDGETPANRYAGRTVTDDPRCPTCGLPNSCIDHNWAYRVWWEQRMVPRQRPQDKP